MLEKVDEFVDLGRWMVAQICQKKLMSCVTPANFIYITRVVTCFSRTKE